MRFQIWAVFIAGYLSVTCSLSPLSSSAQSQDAGNTIDQRIIDLLGNRKFDLIPGSSEYEDMLDLWRASVLEIHEKGAYRLADTPGEPFRIRFTVQTRFPNVRGLLVYLEDRSEARISGISESALTAAGYNMGDTFEGQFVRLPTAYRYRTGREGPWNSLPDLQPLDGIASISPAEEGEESQVLPGQIWITGTFSGWDESKTVATIRDLGEVTFPAPRGDTSGREMFGGEEYDRVELTILTGESPPGTLAGGWMARTSDLVSSIPAGGGRASLLPEMSKAAANEIFSGSGTGWMVGEFVRTADSEWSGLSEVVLRGAEGEITLRTRHPRSQFKEFDANESVAVMVGKDERGVWLKDVLAPPAREDLENYGVRSPNHASALAEAGLNWIVDKMGAREAVVTNGGRAQESLSTRVDDAVEGRIVVGNAVLERTNRPERFLLKRVRDAVEGSAAQDVGPRIVIFSARSVPAEWLRSLIPVPPDDEFPGGFYFEGKLTNDPRGEPLTWIRYGYVQFAIIDQGIVAAMISPNWLVDPVLPMQEWEITNHDAGSNLPVSILLVEGQNVRVRDSKGVISHHPLNKFVGPSKEMIEAFSGLVPPLSPVAVRIENASEDGLVSSYIIRHGKKVVATGFPGSENVILKAGLSYELELQFSVQIPVEENSSKIFQFGPVNSGTALKIEARKTVDKLYAKVTGAVR